MVIKRGNDVNNPPPGGQVATSQKLDDILVSLFDTRDHLVVLENQSPLVDNANLGNLCVDNNNLKLPDHPKNKKARVVTELTNDIKRISPPNFYGTTLGDGAENWISEMEKFFAIRNFSEETKAIWELISFAMKHLHGGRAI
ncbi:hypothetical protein KI387_027057, partial [Taxus chinensis]